jgi:hypothetical protein
MQLELLGKQQVLPVSKRDIVRRLEYRGPIDALLTAVKLPHDYRKYDAVTTARPISLRPVPETRKAVVTYITLRFRYYEAEEHSYSSHLVMLTSILDIVTTDLLLWLP